MNEISKKINYCMFQGIVYSVIRTLECIRTRTRIYTYAGTVKNAGLPALGHEDRVSNN
jgi:hypothetical protein